MILVLRLFLSFLGKFSQKTVNFRANLNIFLNICLILKELIVKIGDFD